jgi:hypothetical protein
MESSSVQRLELPVGGTAVPTALSTWALQCRVVTRQHLRETREQSAARQHQIECCEHRPLWGILQNLGGCELSTSSRGRAPDLHTAPHHAPTSRHATSRQNTRQSNTTYPPPTARIDHQPRRSMLRPELQASDNNASTDSGTLTKPARSGRIGQRKRHGYADRTRLLFGDGRPFNCTVTDRSTCPLLRRRTARTCVDQRVDTLNRTGGSA